MEESLKNIDFNAKNWLKANLELSTSSSVEIQLSELLFNISLCKGKLEDTINHLCVSLDAERESVNNDLKSISSDFLLIKKFLDDNSKITNEILKIKKNEKLFNDIKEMDFKKAKLNETLVLMDQLIALDFNLEEISIFLEECNFHDLENKTSELSETINILMQLSPLDLRREKIEKTSKKIIDVVSPKIEEYLLLNNSKMNNDLCPIIRIMRNFNVSNVFFNLYEKRLETIRKNFSDESKLQKDEFNFQVDLFCYYFKKESDFFIEMMNENLSDFLNENLKLFLEKLIPLIIDNFLRQLTKLTGKDCIDILGVYVRALKFIYDQSSQSILKIEQVESIEELLFSPFFNISKNFISNEKQAIETFVLKKIRKGNEENDSLEEKINEYDFLFIAESIQSSFIKMNEFTLGTEIEEWITLFESIFQEFLKRFGRILNELDCKKFPHVCLDEIINFGRSNKFEVTENILNNFKIIKNINLREHLSLTEALLNKYEELNYLINLFMKIDRTLKSTIIDNISIFNQSIFLKVQSHFYRSNSKLKQAKENLVMSLKNGVVIFNNVFLDVTQIQDKIKKIVLKLFLADSFNKFTEIYQSNIWLPRKGNAIVNLIINKPSNEIISICQNFIFHKQMLEEIGRSMNKSSITSNFLENQGNKSEEKQKIINNLYHSRFKLENYLNENFESYFSSENKEPNEIFGFTHFWTIIYSYFLAKIFCVTLKILNRGKDDDLLIQVKLDLEYFFNVVKEFEYSGSKDVLEQIMIKLMAREENFKNYDFGLFNIK